MKEYLIKDYRNERGGAGVKMLAILVILFLIANAGYNYIPVAYQGASFKEEMQTAVMQGSALPNGGNPIGTTQARIKRVANSNNIPLDAFIEVKQINNAIQAHVIYSKKVNMLPFGLYVYNYQFDHVAMLGGFLMK